MDAMELSRYACTPTWRIISLRFFGLCILAGNSQKGQNDPKIRYKRRPRYHKRKGKSAEWEVAVEKPTYDLTIFKLHCGKLTLKIYTKGERVLRLEAVVHNTQELRCGRSLEKFPQIVVEAKSILHRFMDALSCIDQCFIADDMLEQLPAPCQIGKTKVGGIDLHPPRLRWV